MPHTYTHTHTHTLLKFSRASLVEAGGGGVTALYIYTGKLAVSHITPVTNC